MGCVFCAIVAGRLPSHQVWQDAATLAFMDIRPACEGHLLVIPRRHFETLYEADDETLAAVAASTRRVALALRAALEPDGLSVVQANGEAAGQSVAHYHVHLLPRTRGQRLRMHGAEPGDPERLAALAARIAERL